MNTQAPQNPPEEAAPLHSQLSHMRVVFGVALIIVILVLAACMPILVPQLMNTYGLQKEEEIPVMTSHHVMHANPVAPAPHSTSTTTSTTSTTSTTTVAASSSVQLH